MSGENGVDGRRRLGHIKRVVVKLGSAVIAGKGRLRPKVIDDLAYDVTVLLHQGKELVMVVSGAVAAGFGALGWDRPPQAVVERQAAASVGQHRLMALLAKAFGRHRTQIAQLLMTASDVENRRRFLSARHTLQMLLAHRIVPIINENDALSDDEDKVGDNDHLAALVTSLVSAQLLVVLTTVPGVCSHGGHGVVIPQVEVGSSIDEHLTADTSETGVGGMAAKVSAARLASDWGVPTIIADGATPGLLPLLLDGQPHGTLFVPRQSRLTARKRWIALRSRSLGVIRVDAGAKNALVEHGASLLPSGITAVQGRFPMGARVELRDEQNRPFAVGLVSYSSDDIRRVKGRNSKQFKEILGYEYVKEIVNRDDMVLLES